MTDPTTESSAPLALPRPAPAPDAGPLDERLYDLVEARARRLFRDNPILASSFGVRAEDSRLGDGSRDALEGQIAAEREHLARVEALDDAGLSTAARFERDLELHNVRLGLFELDEMRTWERRPTAAGDIGDSVFLLFARGAAPLAQRLERITDRLEAAPGYLDASRTRAAGTPVGTWLETDLRNAEDLPYLFAEVRAAGQGVLEGAAAARLDRAIAGAQTALESWSGWLRENLGRADDNWPLGPERYDELVRLRAFGDLDADAILAIGEDQLRRNHEGRRAAALEVDPDADEATVIERLKED
ncbi:MAG TPA: DUF885 family protein, partial [Candidatus Limnocylindrales bacterium]